MKKNFLRTGVVLAAALVGAAWSAPEAQAKDIYVDANYTGGNNDGSAARPYRDISGGATWNAIQPGDVVIVLPGTYREAVYLKSGRPGAPVTYRSRDKHAARIIGPSWSHVGAFHGWGGEKGTSYSNDGDPNAWNKWYGGKPVNPIAYVNIERFDISSDRTDGNGVWFQWGHHINITDNRIHDCGGAGIGIAFYDYVNIEWNVVYGNSTKTGDLPNDGFGSGISVFKTRPWDNNGGFHNRIRNNFVYKNYNKQNVTRRSDGNGIIMDTTRFDRGTLIENNVIWDNGGAGIMLASASNVEIRHNTLFRNGWDGNTRYPEIYMQQVTWDEGNDGDPWTSGMQEHAENYFPTTNCNVAGNIISPWRNRRAVQINDDSNGRNCWTNENLRWYEGATSPSIASGQEPTHSRGGEDNGPRDIVQSPEFVDGRTDSWANFRINSWSPARDKISWTATGNDAYGNGRPRGPSKDLGAHEY